MNKTPTLVNMPEMIGVLHGVRGATPISIVGATDPLRSGMRSTGNPFVTGKGKVKTCNIRKTVKVGGMANAIYDKQVERRLEKAINAERLASGETALTGAALEAEIDARFRKGESWHVPVIAADGNITCLSMKKGEDNGTRYIRLAIQNSGEAEYINIESGDTVPSDEVSPFMPSRTNAYSNQGLAEGEEVRFVVYDLASIIEIAIKGERYRIFENFSAYDLAMRRRMSEIADEYLSGERTTTKV